MLDELIATSSPAHIVRATVRHAARAYEERLGLEHVPDRQLPAHGDEGLVVLAARYEEQIHGLIRNYLRSAEYADLFFLFSKLQGGYHIPQAGTSSQ